MSGQTAARSYVLACALVIACLLCCAIWARDAHAGGSPAADRAERKVVRLINRIRVRHGLPRVHRSRALMHAADYHSREMLRGNFFAHSSANGQSMESRVRRFKDAARVGENIAWMPRGTPGSARRVVSVWMNSPGHRAVILTRGFRRIGVGRRSGALGSTGAIVYTADFSSRR